jgi:hypothetical protein
VSRLRCKKTRADVGARSLFQKDNGGKGRRGEHQNEPLKSIATQKAGEVQDQNHDCNCVKTVKSHGVSRSTSGARCVAVLLPDNTIFGVKEKDYKTNASVQILGARLKTKMKIRRHRLSCRCFLRRAAFCAEVS